jgi:hypothetical protein
MPVTALSRDPQAADGARVKRTLFTIPMGVPALLTGAGKTMVHRRLTLRVES